MAVPPLVNHQRPEFERPQPTSDWIFSELAVSAIAPRTCFPKERRRNKTLTTANFSQIYPMSIPFIRIPGSPGGKGKL